MDFRVLGPLEVHDDREGVVPLRAAKERRLLLILLLHANQVVSSELLIDELWGERPPDAAANVLQTYISHLRRLLEPGRRAGEHSLIVTRPPGYVIVLDEAQLDLHRFQSLVADARAEDDPRAALAKLREALALWRGPPLQEFAFEEFAQREIARLDELRLTAREEKIELELGLGQHAELIGELEALAVEHPLRERLRGQLMLALYRCGRQVDALQVYQSTRRLLVDELGIEPGPRLRELEQAILRQDPALELASPVAAPVETPVVEPASPVAEAPPREVRKMVTVAFSDLVESSRLSVHRDPEALRRLMLRYFDEMRAALERHGGIVEKYIGDAIMAVFGVPTLHEDDALRAVRAACEMREALALLNDDLESGWGVRLVARIGVNTGEVIAGDHTQNHLIVTGEAVTVAKRLEELAGPGEILIGKETQRLVRGAFVTEAVDGRRSKHGDATPAFRILAPAAETPGDGRRFDTRLVGRERQLEALRTVYANAVNDRACHLLTVLGPAGVGKSRLLREFIDELDEALVLCGRCLPYGDGITYWPLSEVVRDLVRLEGEHPEAEWTATIAGLLDREEKAELIAERVAEALGLGGRGAGKTDEILWGVRKLFESLARRRPLVVVFDDLQWAEQTFLELVEHVADFARDAPMLLACGARSDLLDKHPGWAGGKLNATSILLEPLTHDDSRELISNLLDAELEADAATRIAEAAEGNPLYAEELVAMLVDEELLTRGSGSWSASTDLAELPVPTGIQALLAARLEGLPPQERAVVARASVEGAVFHRGALAELAPDESAAELEGVLRALVRRDLIRPVVEGAPGDDSFRFRHVLIRDAAYRSLPKAVRSELHEHVAGWLLDVARGRLREVDELVGYHLEQAYRYRAELGAVDDDAASLAAAAAVRLEHAGRRAVARRDLPAAIGLLERSGALLTGDDRARARLLPEHAAALIEAGRLPDADAVLEEARALAVAVEDERAESHALVQQQFLDLLRDASRTEEAARVVAHAVPVFERHRDDHGLCRAYRLEAWLHWNRAQTAAAAQAWERAARHAQRAGDEDERSEILHWVASSILFGPVPVREGIERCERIKSEVAGNFAAEAETLRSLAGLHAMEGRFELARELLATSNAAFAELGQSLNSVVSHAEAIVEMLADNPGAAEQSLRTCYRALEEMGDRAFLSTTAALLAEAILAQGRSDEAERLTETAEELAAGGDVATQIVWRGVRARVLADTGRGSAAVVLAQEAVELADETDLLNHRAGALADLAHVLDAVGRTDEATAAAESSLALYERKENAVLARKVRAHLGALAQV